MHGGADSPSQIHHLSLLSFILLTETYLLSHFFAFLSVSSFVLGKAKLRRVVRCPAPTTYATSEMKSGELLFSDFFFFLSSLTTFERESELGFRVSGLRTSIYHARRII